MRYLVMPTRILAKVKQIGNINDADIEQVEQFTMAGKSVK